MLAALAAAFAAGCGDDDDADRPPGPPPLATATIGAYKFDNPDVAREADSARRATGRYLNEANASADGYRPQPEDRPVCTDPARGNGAIEYVNGGLVDDGELDARRPEVLLYQPASDGSRQLVGVQYRPAEGQSGELFARQVSGPLNVWLFLYNPDGLFAEGNRSSDCRPGPAPQPTARRPQDGPPPGTSPPGVPGGPPPGEEGGPPPGQEGGPPPGQQ